jgi:2-keto-3-deoxy-L-rhamnonate aldolase RhmA
MAHNNSDDFRQKLLGCTPLIGSFIKTPSVHATEILADLGFDFVVIDEEHGPIGRESVDMLMLATRATEIAGIVRVAGLSSILAALDMGASGVLVPHVNTPDEAKAAVASSRYSGGERGFSPSARAGRYGALGLTDHVTRADAAVSVSVMIEHPEAVRNVDAIAAVDGVDALFLGLGDLAVATGEASADTPTLRNAAADVCAAAKRYGKGLIATASSVAAGIWLLELGVNALVVNSDQGLMRLAAAQQLDAFRSRKANGEATVWR